MAPPVSWRLQDDLLTGVGAETQRLPRGLGALKRRLHSWKVPALVSARSLSKLQQLLRAGDRRLPLRHQDLVDDNEQMRHDFGSAPGLLLLNDRPVILSESVVRCLL